MQKSETLTIQLDAEKAHKFRQYCKDNNTTVSETLNNYIDRLLLPQSFSQNGESGCHEVEELKKKVLLLQEEIKQQRTDKSGLNYMSESGSDLMSVYSLAELTGSKVDDLKERIARESISPKKHGDGTTEDFYNAGEVMEKLALEPASVSK